MDDVEPKRKRDPFDDIFRRRPDSPRHNLFDSIFDDVFRDFDSTFADLEDRPEVRSYSFGRRVTRNPDGSFDVEEFGTPPQQWERGGESCGCGTCQTPALEECEPFIDVMEKGDEVSVTVELPGVTREEIKLDAHEDHLVINVDSERKKLDKRVELPTCIDRDSVRAECKNGVLDIVAKKGKEKKGKSVEIE